MVHCLAECQTKWRCQKADDLLWEHQHQDCGNRFIMNIGAAAKGQAVGRALAVGSRTGWFRRESVGAAHYSDSCYALASHLKSIWGWCPLQLNYVYYESTQNLLSGKFGRVIDSLSWHFPLSLQIVGKGVSPWDVSPQHGNAKKLFQTGGFLSWSKPNVITDRLSFSSRGGWSSWWGHWASPPGARGRSYLCHRTLLQFLSYYLEFSSASPRERYSGNNNILLLLLSLCNLFALKTF